MSTNTRSIKQSNRLVPFAGLLLALGLIFSFIAFKSHQPARLDAAVPSIAEGTLRGRAADATRYEVMAQYYAAKKAADLKRSRAADAARWDAMAKYFAVKEAADLKRSRAADTARWEAMAKYFAVKDAGALGH